MKRMAMGVVAGLAVWFGSALAAEAQQITPTGPLAVYANDASETYTATITANNAFWFYLQVFVNGTQVYGGQWFISQNGPSYNFTSPVLNTSSWGLVAGATIDFRGTYMQGLMHRLVSDYTLTVQSGGTSMAPAVRSEEMLATGAHDRKEWDSDGHLDIEEGILA